MQNEILLSTAYFGPVQFYTKVIGHNVVYIEQFENFIKQTYRNRCVILGGNGPVSLVVPVVKGRGPKTLIKDIRISYDVDWQRNHWRTIFSAYNSSPFFEFYQDDLIPFFQKKWNYLLDFNLEIHNVICDCIDIENDLVLTDSFKNVPEDTIDFKSLITPKIKDNNFKAATYTQVFAQKFDFIQNLSILDLLFNEGPNSYTILEKSNI